MSDGRASEFADFVSTNANGRAMGRLCRLLHAKGVLTRPEFEMLRHHYLHDFDAISESSRLLPQAVAALQERREQMERSWVLPEDRENEPGPSRTR